MTQGILPSNKRSSRADPSISPRRVGSGAISIAARQIDVNARFTDTVPANKVVTVSGSAPTQTGSKGVFQNGSWRSLDSCRYREGQPTELTCTAAFVGTPAVGEYALIGVGTADGQSGFFWGSRDGEDVFVHRIAGVDHHVLTRSAGEWDDPLDGTGDFKATWDRTKANVWALSFLWHGNGNVLLDIAGVNRESYQPVVTMQEVNTEEDAHIPDPDVYVWIEASANMSVQSSSWALGTYAGFRDSVISAGNSTTTQLGNGGVFTGEAVEVLNYQQINITLLSDQPSASMGIQLQGSQDEAIWFDLAPPFTHSGTASSRLVEGGTAGVRTFQLPPGSRYFRVKYTNGTTPTTELAIQTVLLPFQALTTVHRVDDPISGDRSVTVVKSVATAEQPDGDYVTAKADGEAFNTEALLGAGGTYTSPWVDSDGWETIEVFISSDVISAGDGVKLQFTDDAQAGTPTVRGEESFTFSASDIVRGYLPISRTARLDGFRVEYTNGVTPQGSFYLSATLRTAPAGIPIDSLEGEINDTSTAGTVRTGLFAEDGSTNLYELIGKGGLGTGLDSHTTDSEPRAIRKPLTRSLVGTFDLTTTSQQIDASQLTSRSALLLFVDPDNNQAVHINLGSSATTASLKLDAGYGLPMTLGNEITIHGRSTAGTQRVYLWQFGEPL